MMMESMKSSARKMAVLVEHRKSKNRAAAGHPQRGQGHTGSTLYGAGRLAKQQLRSIRPSGAGAADARALFVRGDGALLEAEATEARKKAAKFLHGDGESGGLISEIAEAVRDEQAQREGWREAARREQDEDEDDLTPRERLLREEPPH